MFVTGLQHEKRIDPKATEIIGLGFGLEEILSSIFKEE